MIAFCFVTFVIVKVPRLILDVDCTLGLKKSLLCDKDFFLVKFNVFCFSDVGFDNSAGNCV